MRRWWVMALFGAAVAAGCRREEAGTNGGAGQEAGETRLQKRPRPEEESEVEMGKKRVAERWEEAKAMADGEEKWRLMESVAWDMLEWDPELTREIYEQLPEGGAEAMRLTEHLAMRAAEENPEEAEKWAETLANEGERQAAFGRIAVVVSNEDPEAAVRLLDGKMSDGAARDRAAVEVVQRWAPKSPEAAAEWLSGESRPGLRMAGWGEIFRTWDAGELGKWVEKAPPELRKEMTTALARSLKSLPEPERRVREEAWGAELRREVRALMGQGE